MYALYLNFRKVSVLGRLDSHGTFLARPQKKNHCSLSRFLFSTSIISLPLGFSLLLRHVRPGWISRSVLFFRSSHAPFSLSFSPSRARSSITGVNAHGRRQQSSCGRGMSSVVPNILPPVESAQQQNVVPDCCPRWEERRPC